MDGTTGIVLGVIFGLVGMVIAILKYISDKQKREDEKLVKQTELTIKLANIEKELAEIKTLLITNTEKYTELERRVFILEEKRKEGKNERKS